MARYLWSGFSFQSCALTVSTEAPRQKRATLRWGWTECGKAKRPSHSALAGKLAFAVGAHKWNESHCVKSVKYLRGQKVTKYKTVQRISSRTVPVSCLVGQMYPLGGVTDFLFLCWCHSKVRIFFFLICNVSYKVTLWFTSNTDAEGYVDFLKLSSSILFTGLGYCRWRGIRSLIHSTRSRS